MSFTVYQGNTIEVGRYCGPMAHIGADRIRYELLDSEGSVSMPRAEAVCMAYEILRHEILELKIKQAGKPLADLKKVRKALGI